MAFPKYVLIYLFGKPIASSYPLVLRCMIAWILKLSRISVSMAFNLTLCHMIICWEVGLEYHSNTTEKYLHTPCPRQVILKIVVELVDHLHVGSCFELPYFIAEVLILSNYHLSSLYLLDPFSLLKFFLCFLKLGKAMIPFLCIYTQKSYFLIMHYSWGSYPTMSRTPLFFIGIVSSCLSWTWLVFE